MTPQVSQVTQMTLNSDYSKGFMILLNVVFAWKGFSLFSLKTNHAKR